MTGKSTNGHELSDTVILKQAAGGDEQAFGMSYERYVGRIYNYVYYRTGNQYDAEDLTARVFLRAMKHIPNYQDRGIPFSAWLYRMAANALADYWRRQGRESQELPPDVPDERVHEELERRISLFQLVDRLPDLQRRVIEMRFVEDKSVREVAVTLDRTEGAVKQLQFRALENLRKGMGLS